MGYVVLLNANSLYMRQCDLPDAFPDAFFRNLKDVKYFESKDESIKYICSKCTFDDMYEFGAEKDFKEGVYYHRAVKSHR